MSTKNYTSDTVTVADLKEDLATLKADFSKLVTGLAESGKEQVGESIKKATASVQALAGRSQDSAKEAHVKIAACVSERPITSLAIAVLAGALLSRIYTRN